MQSSDKLTRFSDSSANGLSRNKVLRKLIEQSGPPILIGVAGDSGSGKTTYTNGLRRMLGHDIVGTIACDGYHKENRPQRRRSGQIPLDPEANHLDLLYQHLLALKRGEQVQVPIYNHRTGTFDAPRPLTAPPILVVEGLHALYPQFLPLLDFAIFVEPDRDIKQRWKIARDLRYRGHIVEYLTAEIRQREAGYKRWIEFQKTDANAVIKIHQSHLQHLSDYQLEVELPQDTYHMEVIFQPVSMPLPDLRVPINLARMLGEEPNPFMLSVVPCRYWGRRANVIHLDGIMTRRNVLALERQIVEFTGIPLRAGDPDQQHERMSALQFTQLLVTWPILEHIAHILQKRNEHSCTPPACG
ncbi:MAG: phosphoribulokinase [Gammaproteobacteria bacterium]